MSSKAMLEDFSLAIHPSLSVHVPRKGTERW
jgi:hypothetical protein